MNPQATNEETLSLTDLSRTRRDMRRRASPDTSINVMSIDLEEWFQVTNFENVIARSDWDSCLARIPEILPRLLDIFSSHNVHATFFTLGWIAERYPLLIRRIHKEGHEIASHGYDHRLVTMMTRAEFRKELIQAKDILEQVLGEPIYGYRAPTYSFRKETQWVIEELLHVGFLYDSSIFPFGSRYNPALSVSRYPCLLSRQGGELTEYPLSIVKLCGMDVPIAGGGYFRLLPYTIVRQGLQQLKRSGKPAIMYFHPWELDPEQPRVSSASWSSKFRHYINLEHNETKIKRLVKEFHFASIRDIFWNEKEKKFDTAVQI